MKKKEVSWLALILSYLSSVPVLLLSVYHYQVVQEC